MVYKKFEDTLKNLYKHYMCNTETNSADFEMRRISYVYT